MNDKKVLAPIMPGWAVHAPCHPGQPTDDPLPSLSTWPSTAVKLPSLAVPTHNRNCKRIINPSAAPIHNRNCNIQHMNFIVFTILYARATRSALGSNYLRITCHQATNTVISCMLYNNSGLCNRSICGHNIVSPRLSVKAQSPW